MWAYRISYQHCVIQQCVLCCLTPPYFGAPGWCWWVCGLGADGSEVHSVLPDGLIANSHSGLRGWSMWV
jgi:hypothetical protein